MIEALALAGVAAALLGVALLTSPTARLCRHCGRAFNRNWSPAGADNPLYVEPGICPECSGCKPRQP